MRNSFWFSLACWSCIALSGLVDVLAQETPPAAAAASESVISVHLRSGRTFAAAIDARTDQTQLWLRFQQAGAELLRPICWQRVVWAEVAGEKLSGEELRRLVEQVRQEIPAQPVVPAARTNIVMIGPPATEKGTVPICRNGPEGATHKWGLSPFPPADVRRVVSLAIDANVGRWDENVEPDGLLVHVYPLDADGAIVPVRGTLSVDLKAERTGSGGHRLQEPFVDAGHWSEAVRPADFGPRGAVYRLRFQGIHPEFASWVASLGAVHASLSVPGQGTFDATADMVRIRPYSTVRDHLQQITRHGYFPGYRYFPNERTDDGRR